MKYLEEKLKDLRIEPLKEFVYENCKGCDCTIEATEYKPHICPCCGRVVIPCNVCNELDIRSIFMIDKCDKECPVLRVCNRTPETVKMYTKPFLDKEAQNKAISKEYDRIQNLLND